MAFVGEAQIQSPTGRSTVSRLFFAPLAVDSSGAATVAAPIRDNNDDLTLRKGRPSVVQSGAAATIFFSGMSAGTSEIYYTTWNPGLTGNAPEDRWSKFTTISTGTGFDSVSDPSVYPRVYQGPAYQPSGLTTGQNVLEMTFQGKLRGRPNAEIYFGTLLADANFFPIASASGLPTFSLQPLRTQEPMTGDSNGVYRAQGVAWSLAGGFRLEQALNGVVANLEVTDASGNPTTRTIDQATGLMTFTSTLGGKVYVDPNMGTVRFAGAVPSNQAVLLATYQPLFLRVSGAAQDAAYGSSTCLYDDRQIGDASYWARAGTGQGIQNTDSDVIGSARYVFTFDRSSAAAGTAARPFYRTMRLGVQLPTSIATQPDGTVTNLTVTGNVGPYQVDPVGGRVYFTDPDENQAVTVTYTGIDENANVLAPASIQSLVTLVAERNETPLVIEQAIHEDGLTALLDPFDPGGQIGARRPGLIWLFWTSTRAGAPDIYFETMAPRLTPVPTGQ